MSLLLQRTAQEMGASAAFHAYQMDLSVRGEAQQLRSRKLLAHDNFPALVQTYQMKVRFAEINADRVYLHGMSPCDVLPPFFVLPERSGKSLP